MTVPMSGASSMPAQMFALPMMTKAWILVECDHSLQFFNFPKQSLERNHPLSLLTHHQVMYRILAIPDQKFQMS